jgi:hypothetical protein
VNLLSEDNEEVLTTTTSDGDTNFMVCSTSEQDKKQKVCMDVNSPERKSASPTQTTKNRRMLDNNTYDLMEQLLIENKSLWRIKNNYKNDASMDSEAKQLWNVIEEEKEDLVQLLSDKLRERL